jgi:hypothetical protein
MPVFVEYRDIPGFPGCQAGSDGSIRIHEAGNIWKHLSLTINRLGYKQTHLTGQDEICRTYLVHTLILLAFVGPCPAGQECRHLNGIRCDNNLDNVCWGTPEENEADKVRHGTAQRGSKHYRAKLSDEKIHAIRNMLAQGFTHSYISRLFTVSRSTISLIHQGKSWRSVHRG